MRFLKSICLLFCVLISSALFAQNSKKAKSQKYPESFTISNSVFEHLFVCKKNETIRTKSNKYLDKSELMISTQNGDMKFLKLKLSYFKNAYLLIQMSGKDSKQIFLTTDDKSVFYTGRLDQKNNVLVKQCDEDDIVSE